MAATIKIRVSQIKLWIEISIWFRGSGCGSVDRAVASDTRDPRFESRHWQTFIKHLFTVNCVEKTKIKKKEAGNGPFFLKKVLGPVLKISPLATFSFIKVKSHFSDANFELNFSILIHK